MPQPRVLILRAPGTNCDHETDFAFRQAGAITEMLHVNRLVERPETLADFQILCLPGGFSYGDDIAAGRILANRMKHHLFDALQGFKENDKLIIGICNGFQILVKSGLLVDEVNNEPVATLTWNESGKFEDRWVNLRVDGSKSVFLRGVETMYLPVAHAEGKFVTRDEASIQSLDDSGQLVLRYSETATATATATANANAVLPFPLNPNGAQRNVAGICDPTGRVLGLMPHPERFVDPTHHPQWTRKDRSSIPDGIHIFKNAVEYFA